jgi:SOS response regulatory protein OraA/RecX
METFTISRQELRRILVAFNVSEKNIEQLFSSMEKAHRHINAIVFSSLLEKASLDKDKIGNVLRRLGLDDIAIRKVLEASDEQKIVAETGRLFEATLVP